MRQQWQKCRPAEQCDPEIFQKCPPNGLIWKPPQDFSLFPQTVLGRAVGPRSRELRGLALTRVPILSNALTDDDGADAARACCEKSVGEQKLSDNAYRSLLSTLAKAISAAIYEVCR